MFLSSNIGGLHHAYMLQSSLYRRVSGFAAIATFGAKRFRGTLSRDLFVFSIERFVISQFGRDCETFSYTAARCCKPAIAILYDCVRYPVKATKGELTFRG